MEIVRFWSRKDAAEISGLTELKIKNMMSRNGLFGHIEESRRQGVKSEFDVRNLLTLKVVAEFKASGFSDQDAAHNASGTPYGRMIHGRDSRGELICGYDKREKRWSSASWPCDGITLRLPLWPLFWGLVKHERVLEAVEPVAIDWNNYLERMTELQGQQMLADGLASIDAATV